MRSNHVSGGACAERRCAVVLVHGHPVVLCGLEETIRQSLMFEVAGAATNAEEGLRLVEQVQPDIAIVDLGLSDGDGLNLVRQLRSRVPLVKVVAVSLFDAADLAPRALRAGVVGVICLHEPLDGICRALAQVVEGEIHLSPSIAGRLLQHVALGEPIDGDPVAALTNREFQIFQMIGDGKTTRQIARRLVLSVKTVETHRTRIKRKLNLQNSAQLSRAAIEWRLDRHRAPAATAPA